MASAIRVTVLTSDEGEQFGSDDTVVRDTPLFSPDNGSTYVNLWLLYCDGAFRFGQPGFLPTFLG